MNRTELVNEVAAKTNMELAKVDVIIKASEEIGGLTLLNKFKFKKNNKADLLEKISMETSYPQEDCETILNAFEEVFGQALSDKLTFKGKKK